jgi:methionyl aminopeptidase
MIAGRRVTLKSRSQIEQMRRAGRIVADVLDMLGEQLRPGVTTADLDRMAGEFISRAGATPSFIGVPGAGGPYRHATCV